MAGLALLGGASASSSVGLSLNHSSAIKLLPLRINADSASFEHYSAFDLCVARTFKPAVSGEFKGSHYIVLNSALTV